MMKLPGGSLRLETGWAAKSLGVGSSVIRHGRCSRRGAAAGLNRDGRRKPQGIDTSVFRSWATTQRVKRAF